MPDNNSPSDFVSWGQQLALTGDEEERLYNKALAEAQREQQAAGASLEGAYGQATDANKREIADTGAAATTVSQTGSYNDYLKHQQAAQAKAQAALTGGGNSVSNLMRQQLAPQAWGSTAKFDSGTQALLQRQAQLERSRARVATNQQGMWAAEQQRLAAAGTAKDEATPLMALARAPRRCMFASYALSASWLFALAARSRADALN